jgi:PilZ domain
MYIERRQQNRFELRAICEFEWRDSQNVKRSAEAVCRDISSKGLYLWSESLPPVGTYIALKVFLKTQGAGPKLLIEITARVVRVVPAKASDDVPAIAVENKFYQLKRRLVSPDDLIGPELNGPELVA